MNLLKYEFKRLFKSKGFYISLAVCVILAVISVLTQNLIYKASLETEKPISVFAIEVTKKAFGSSLVMMIAAIFTAIFVTDEYQTGTIKTVITKGYSSNQIFIAKYLSSLVSTLIFYFAYVFVTSQLANSFFDNKVTDSTLITSLLISLLLVVAYHTIYFSISISTRKLGIAIALNIVGPTLVGLVLGMGDALIKNESFKFTNYWLDSLISNLTNLNTTNKALILGLVLGVIYLGIAGTVGVFLNRRKEY